MVRLETAPTEWDQVNLVLFPIQTVGAISEIATVRQWGIGVPSYQ